MIRTRPDESEAGLDCGDKALRPSGQNHEIHVVPGNKYARHDERRAESKQKDVVFENSVYRRIDENRNRHAMDYAENDKGVQICNRVRESRGCGKYRGENQQSCRADYVTVRKGAAYSRNEKKKRCENIMADRAETACKKIVTDIPPVKHSLRHDGIKIGKKPRQNTEVVHEMVKNHKQNGKPAQKIELPDTLFCIKKFVRPVLHADILTYYPRFGYRLNTIMPTAANFFALGLFRRVFMAPGLNLTFPSLWGGERQAQPYFHVNCHKKTGKNEVIPLKTLQFYICAYGHKSRLRLLYPFTACFQPQMLRLRLKAHRVYL